jgi:biotin synthase
MNMKIEKRIQSILEQGLEGNVISKEDCIELLRLHELSLEAALLRSVANGIARKRFRNRAMLLGQIGIETFPCPANCQFCVFGEKHTLFPKTEMSDTEIIETAHSFVVEKKLYALFLMVMHTFDEQRLIRLIESVRKNIPSSTTIVLNIGDFSFDAARSFATAGVTGAYHVLRLREGADTGLDPEQRKKTVRSIKDAGLDWYYCCEPIGPEHTPEELADQIFFGLEYECFQHAAMRRVSFPGGPLSHYGMISDLRLAQIVAVVAMANIANPALASIAVHEPSVLGLTAGANSVYAEAGANPRDTSEETSEGRGRNTKQCSQMFADAGFDSTYNKAGTEFKLKVM